MVALSAGGFQGGFLCGGGLHVSAAVILADAFSSVSVNQEHRTVCPTRDGGSFHLGTYNLVSVLCSRF